MVKYTVYDNSYGDGWIQVTISGEGAEALEACEIEELLNKDNWLPIETAPRDGTVIDSWGGKHLYPLTGRRAENVSLGRVLDTVGNECEGWQTGETDDFEPTHLMPMPPVPE